jgi:LPS sulfotransferase NodH
MRQAFPIPYDPSPHELRFLEFFGERGLRVNEKTAPRDLRTYILCFTNRCGSNFLAELIATNRSFGVAAEYLNAKGVLAIAEKKSFVTLQQYLRWLVRRKTSLHNIFGLKLSYRQLFFLVKYGFVPRLFGEVRFIHMQRCDVLAQAVSLLIASQTNVWTSRQPEAASPVHYKERQIVNLMTEIRKANAMFQSFFDVYGIRPVCVSYEELVADPAVVASRALSELGFGGLADLSVDPVAVPIRRQANRLNEEFATRLRARFQLDLPHSAA